jgi:hypothetical protein
MYGISARTLLTSHVAVVLMFCVIAVVGYMGVLTIARIFAHEDLSVIHQNLRSSWPFEDIYRATATSLAAMGAGCLAAALSKAKPLLHGALSSVLFFLWFAFTDVHAIIWIWTNEYIEPHSHRLQRTADLAIPLFGLLGAYILTLIKHEPSTNASQQII